MPTPSFILGLLCGWLVLSPGANHILAAEPLRVWAAASLTDALREVGAAYENAQGQRIAFNFAGSSVLARQIEAGAPADLFFSADEAKMDRLEAKGLIVRNSRCSRWSNQLVLVVNQEEHPALETPRDLVRQEVRRIALAEPETVPAGVYAKAYLEKLNLWSAIQRKVVPTQNVRAALAAVEAGNVDAAFVYKTDVAIATRVKVVYQVPLDEGPTISYPVSVLKQSKQPEAARRFLDYLKSSEASEIFVKYGFISRWAAGSVL
jgi:molybdate transport system substrate-binding protein